MQQKFITKVPTVSKLKPFDSSELRSEEKISIPASREFEIDQNDPAPGGHIQVKLREPLKFGKEEHYVCFFFGKHIQLIGEQPEQEHTRLEVPYKSQTDNFYNPTGSCNVTSIAMGLEYFGVQKKTTIQQLEDELYISMQQLGLSRHSPADLATMVTRYGIKDKLAFNATIEGVQKHLEGGNPAVTHGYFTSFGHIIVLVGYDERGFIVHDPYGEWFPDGYDRNDNRNNEKGKFLYYSYDLIRRTCIPDGEFWVHFISK